MYYSVCLGALYPNVPVEDALARIRKAGLTHYEFWSWWDRDMDAHLAAQQATGVAPAALCTHFISLTDPACRDAYVAGLRETIEVCKKLGCPTIISQVGNELPGVPRQEQHDSIVDGLRACLPYLQESGLTLVIEPLNTRVDHPGYYLWQAAEAFQIIDEVGDKHVKVLLDMYHQHVMDDLDVNTLVNNIDKIGHFHMAGNPGRHEPLESGMDYVSILRRIEQTGYEMAIGLEYFPVKDADEGLNELCAALHAQ